MPASVSATQVADNRLVANTVFDFVRERMHHGIKRLFNNGYATDVIEELDEKELVAIVGDPTSLQELDKGLLDNAMANWAIQVKNTTGMYPTEEEYAQNYELVHQELMKQGDMRYPQIKKELIKDMDLFFDFSVVNESYDKKAKLDTLMTMKNDPASTKSKAKIEDSMLDLMNENPRAYDKSPEELAKEEQMRQEQMMAESGQMAAPAPIQ
jgi:hypothetical protein